MKDIILKNLKKDSLVFRKVKSKQEIKEKEETDGYLIDADENIFGIEIQQNCNNNYISRYPLFSGYHLAFANSYKENLGGRMIQTTIKSLTLSSRGPGYYIAERAESILSTIVGA